MRITVLSPYLPTAETAHAGGRFLVDYLSYLGHEHDVVLVTVDPAHRSRSLVDVDVLSVTTVPATGARRLLDLAASAARGTVSPGGPTLRALCTDARVQARLEASDVVDVHWTHLVPVLEYLRPQSLVSCFLYDVLSQSLQRKQQESLRRVDRLRAGILLPVARAREVQAINRTQVAAVLTAKDETLLREAGVTSHLHVVNPPFSPREVAEIHRQDVLFVGDMTRAENLEGLQWFVTDVWPAVRGACPEAKLRVVGTSAPASLAGVPGVEVVGFVDDLAAEYARAAVAIAPLRLGAGVKFKVLEAMAHSVPVATTPVGAEGISDDADLFAALTADPTQLAAGLVGVLREPPHGRAIASRATLWLTRQPTFSASMEGLVDLWRARLP